MYDYVTVTPRIDPNNVEKTFLQENVPSQRGGLKNLCIKVRAKYEALQSVYHVVYVCLLQLRSQWRCKPMKCMVSLLYEIILIVTKINSQQNHLRCCSAGYFKFYMQKIYNGPEMVLGELIDYVKCHPQYLKFFCDCHFQMETDGNKNLCLPKDVSKLVISGLRLFPDTYL